MRIIGLDFGDKTVGVAVSDPMGWTAQGLEVIRRKDENSLKDSLNRISEIVKQYEADTIVLGYPKNMDNSEGIRCEKTVLFKKKLENKIPSVNVILRDERLSTVGAERSLLEADLSRAKRGKVVDKMAAVFILQGYLDYLQANKNKTNESALPTVHDSIFLRKS